MATAREIVGRSGGLAGDSSSRDTVRRWFVEGAASELIAVQTVALAAPGLVDGLLITGIDPRETVENCYEVDVTYGLWRPKQPEVAGESSFNFEIATQPVRIVVPLSAQTVYTRSGESAPADSSTWLIGQQGDGSAPEGAEVSEPIANFSETHWIAANSITQAYQRTVLKVIGRINQSPFRGWQAEEVLCTGVSGSQRGADDWEVSFRFGVREHQTGLTVAGIEDVDKKGWQYLWPRYELAKDSTEPILSNKVKYIVVADVFRTANFTQLGIGF
jgi:hypothetical protein